MVGLQSAYSYPRIEPEPPVHPSPVFRADLALVGAVHPGGGGNQRRRGYRVGDCSAEGGTRLGCVRGALTLSVEKPLVEKRRAAAPRTCGIISTERVGRLHAWSQICAGGAVVKMPSLAARAVPPASVARLLAAWCGPAEWRSVQGESPAPRGVKSEQGSVEPCDDLQEPSGSCIARVQTSL